MLLSLKEDPLDIADWLVNRIAPRLILLSFAVGLPGFICNIEILQFLAGIILLKISIILLIAFWMVYVDW